MRTRSLILVVALVGPIAVAHARAGEVELGRAQRPAPTRLGGPRAAPSRGLAGEWRGINGTAGAIVIDADGTYHHSSGGEGKVTKAGDKYRFSGPLEAWGAATVTNGVLEFYFVRGGFKVLFQFQKL